MTTVAWDGSSLAADRLVTENGARVGYVDKVRRTSDNRLLAGSGSVASMKVLMNWVEDGGDRPNPWPEDAEVMEVLPNGRVRCHEKGGVVDMDPGPQVLGSGGRFAQAAMACGKTAQEAVSIAILFDVYSGGDVVSVDHGAIDVR